MRNLKKFLALVLAFVMAMSLMVTVNASDFGDSEDINEAYTEAVDLLTELGVIKGYETEDGDMIFQPEKSIKRSEVAAIMYRIVTGDVEDKNIHLYEGFTTFSDVPENEWYTPYVNYCADNGLVVGVGGDQFAPNSNVTGYHILIMVLRAMGYNNPTEFTGEDWRMKASGYGTRLGITKNIPAGNLSGYAERQVVSEIIFRGIQAPTVSYSPLLGYTQNVLVAAGTKTSYVDGDATKEAVTYTSNVYSTLLYEIFDVVGLHKTIARDDYGRPQYAWVKDQREDSVALGTKYVPNCDSPLDDATAGKINSDIDDADAWTDVKNADVVATGNYAPYKITMAPIDVETNGIDECDLATKINNNKSILWTDISEFLNGNGPANSGVGAETFDNSRTGSMDATHTSVDYIGETGRTTEIYKYTDPTTRQTKWSFVYIDTFLGEVVDTTAAIKDTNGHVIREATATVELGNNLAAAGGVTAPGDAAAPVKLTLDNEDGKYEKGQMVLIQTSGGVETSLDTVSTGEKAPVTPTKVPDTFAEFYATPAVAEIIDNATKVSGVKVIGTVGKDNEKMGIRVEGRDDPYYASNTFLAARATNKTVLADYYDVGVADMNAANVGINNGMIGKSYDLYLDHHGYIVGLVEVVESNSTVGVITNFEGKRLATGKYVVEVEAFMTDETTQTFDLINVTALSNKNTTGAKFFTGLATTNPNGTDGAFGNGGTYQALGIGSLVEFGQTSLGGYDVWYIKDYDNAATATNKMQADVDAGNDYGALGRVDKDNAVATGVADTLNTDSDNSDISTVSLVNDDTIFFVAEYDFRYNLKPGENTGAYADKSYTVYKGFKNLPTITDNGGDDNILYQALSNGTVLVYAANTDNDYTVTTQKKITVDESYLVLSRGTTYADHATYNVLKNGEPDVLSVANLNNAAGNTGLNEIIDAAMLDGDLIVVTSQNSKGYATAVDTLKNLAANGTNAQKALVADNVGAVTDSDAPRFLDSSTDKEDFVSYDKGVLTVTATDATGNGSEFLTVDDNCKVIIVNLSRGTYYASDLATAMEYAVGVDKDALDDNLLLDEHSLVYELNELGYVCTLYVLD